MKDVLAIVLGVAVLTGCYSDGNRVDSQTRALTLSADSMAVRQMQSRRFDTGNESLILNATTAVLQDMGYAIGETSVASGLVSASGRGARVSVTVRPVGRTVTVRAAFQDAGGGRIVDPVFYRNFFDKLSQSVFLEAYQI